MSICRYENLVLACDFADNHSPAYVCKMFVYIEEISSGGVCPTTLLA